MLTKKQRELLVFIHERMSQGDIAPSFEEMKVALGLKSKSGIHRLISALVERGYLERLPHRARALEVKKLPEGYHPDKNDHTRVSGQHEEIQSLIENNAMHASIASIPLYGRIAAGTPIEAIRDEGQTIDIPPHMLGNGEHYALEVDGDSMINAGIHDHDIVIIKRADTAHDGAIVVALVDDNEVTLKTLRREKNKVILVPENDDYKKRVLDADRVKIQGTLASLYRNYH